ncbi:MAG: hypothetical protein JNM56_05270 [Planctomycetia bacterium]|nr:hypothetical protein [Planctomycetia bacterium]
MIQVFVGSDYLFKALGCHPTVGDKYRKVLNAIASAGKNPLASVTSAFDLSKLTVYEVLKDFHDAAFSSMETEAQELLDETCEEMKQFANSDYQLSDYTQTTENVRNALAVHGLLPHGKAVFEVVEPDGPQRIIRDVLLPDLALGASIFGYIVAPGKFERDASAHASRVVDVLTSRWWSVAALECHLCDSLSFVYERARAFFECYWNEMETCQHQMGVSTLTPEIRQMLDEELKDILSTAPTDFRPEEHVYIRDLKQQLAQDDMLPSTYDFVNRRLKQASLYGKPIATDSILVLDAYLYGLVSRRNLKRRFRTIPPLTADESLRASAVRLGIARPLVQELFPLKLWAPLPEPVKHFIFDAARIAGAVRCRPATRPLPPEVTSQLAMVRVTSIGSDDIPLDLFKDVLQRIGLYEPWRQLTESNLHRDDLDLLQATNETLGAIYNPGVELSLFRQEALDLYPLHKRVLGLLEYRILPKVEEQFLRRDGKLPDKANGASGLWTVAFTGAQDQDRRTHRVNQSYAPLTGASLRPSTWEADGKKATFETEGNWLLHAHYSATTGNSSIDLAALLDDVSLRMAAAFTGISAISFSPANPQAHAGQLATLADRTNPEAARMTLYLAKLVLMLRNAIEHGTDELVSEGLLIKSPGYWTQQRGRGGVFQWLKHNAAHWRSGSSLPPTFPNKANAFVLTPASLHRCLVLVALVLYASYSQLSIK